MQHPGPGYAPQSPQISFELYRSRRAPRFVILAALFVLPFAAAFLALAGGFSAPGNSVAMAAAPVQLRPYAYARISSNCTYDIVLADGIREIRVARIKVDSVFFGNVSARLSIDGSMVAFRVSGDRQGGSELYSVDT